jgi:HK97 gp10 family phage protein
MMGLSRVKSDFSRLAGPVRSRRIRFLALGLWEFLLMAMKNRDKFLKKLAAIQGLPRVRMKEALRKSATEISAMQKRLAPVDSGDLRNSIGFTFGTYTAANANVRGTRSGGGGDPDLTVILHAGDAKAFYAAFIEYGVSGPYEIGGKFDGATHPGFTAQPFFYPAVRVNRRKTLARIRRAGRKALKDAAKS